MTKYSLCLFLLFFIVPLYAEYTSDMYDFQVFLATHRGAAGIKKKIAEYEEKYKDSLYEYTQIILSKYKMFSKKYKVVSESDYVSSREIRDGLDRLNEQWVSEEKTRDLKSDEYRVWAEVKTQRLGYLSFISLVKDSSRAHKYYKKAIKLDKKNTAAYIQLGMWSIFAPKIGGGGVDKAIKYLEKAVKLSRNDLDTYNAYLWLAQAYVKRGTSTEHVEALEKAKEVFGETFFYTHIESLAKQGKILGE